ncbi:DapH/DapD/GlmU-related protein [Dokdonia sp. Asnod3-C12]|uniref:DapH/DapD/GlmU-related protein n=1 Tax=Dokdonia sp. Asnod3-C12 TaxID=3160575 RepID=UPI00386F9DAC
MTFSPIVLFVYNRPFHTKQTLDALAQNEEAKESVLHIYCDGTKEDSDRSLLTAINEVRALADGESRFKEVKVIKRDTNFGLAENIKDGVSTVVNKYGHVIVLEDDIIVSKGFLKYMNDALCLYKDDADVMHISGYMYPHKRELPETFFYNVTLCWGWATWKDAWSHFNDSSVDLWNAINMQVLFCKLDGFGGDYLSKQLAANITGDLKTWFVKWHASVILKGGFTLFPRKSLVDNIGFDNSGVHNGSNSEFAHRELAKGIAVERHPKIENAEARDVITSFYNDLKKKATKGIRKRIVFKMKGLVYKIVPDLKKFKNSIVNSHLGSKTKIYPRATIINSVIGNYTYVSQNSSFKNTVVGKFCSIGPNLVCGWGIHPSQGISTSPMFYSTAKQNGLTLCKQNKFQEFAPIRIGNDVFIGMNVTILDGVTIGDGAIIGAGAVVSKDIPAYAVAVGNPIKIIKYRFEEEQIEKLKKIQWWDFNEDDLQLVENYFDNIHEFVSKSSVNL